MGKRERERCREEREERGENAKAMEREGKRDRQTDRQMKDERKWRNKIESTPAEDVQHTRENSQREGDLASTYRPIIRPPEVFPWKHCYGSVGCLRAHHTTPTAIVITRKGTYILTRHCWNQGQRNTTCPERTKICRDRIRLSHRHQHALAAPNDRHYLLLPVPHHSVGNILHALRPRDRADPIFIDDMTVP